MKKLLGTALIAATGALIAIASMPVRSPELATAQQTVDQPFIENETPQVSTTRQRHTITVTVSSPDDLKVTEGERIEAGEVVADRTREREKLIQEREQLELAIAKALQPTPTPPPPPEPTYAQELAAIEEAREMIAYYQQLPEPEYRFKQEDLILSLDAERVAQRQGLVQKRIEAQQELNSAIANLQTAKARYQRELYNYNISLTQAEAEQKQRQIEVLRLREGLDELNQQIEELGVVRSPYAGRVRRVEIINQNNLTITAEITLLVTKRES